ncbi:MAG: pilus assembly protein PilM [Lachnospiraceae bacterium]|nr:pilus assembly protein PilM [Lachnospiraceae bacterium]MDE6626582.1 pilus assembly protein PilM [Lachnospiraceae bacterium]
MAKSNKVLTVEITNESITVIEVTPSIKKQTNVHNALIFETPEDAYEDGALKDVDRIARVIREQLDANGITNKNVIFILSSSKVVNREVLIPEVKENKVKGIVDANASEYFPVNIEDYVVSHSILEHVVDDDKSKQLKLMVVAAPIVMVKGYYELGSMLGLNVQSIDYVGNAMLQLIKTQTSATMTTMVIQLGSESTILNIVKGDTLLLQRTVPYGTNAVVTEVMDEKGVDATTAMTLLQNERLITVDFDDNAATGAFRYLINNIGRVIDYYVTKNPDKPIDDVFLTGDGALIRGIDGLFKIQLNIQTRVMDSLYNIKFDSKIDLKIYNPVYLIAPIGAAFDPMGFVQSTAKTKGSSDISAVKAGTGVLVVGVIAAAAMAGVTIVMKNNAIAERDSLNQQIAAIADIDQIVTDYDAAKARRDDMHNMYDQTRTLNENVSMFFEALEENLPKTIAINSYESSDEGVMLNGVTDDYPAIAKFIRQLKKIECIQDAFLVDLVETESNGTGAGENQITTTYYEFNITANFVSMVEEDTEEESVGDAVLEETTAE